MKKLFGIFFACLLIVNVFALYSAANAQETYNYVTQWGGKGSSNGQFDVPSGVAVDSSGNVFVADSNNSRIQKFDNNGNFLTSWGSKGADSGQFSLPWSVAVDRLGNVFVADMGNHRIQKFDNSGNFLNVWSKPGAFVIESGSGNREFNNPWGVAVDNSGNIFVADRMNYRIQKLASNGEFLTAWGTKGTENGQFDIPSGVAVDQSGNVFVSDSNNHRIQKFDNNGNFLLTWGRGSDIENGALPGLCGLETASNGNVFACASLNRIQIFDNNGNFISGWGSYGSGKGSFSGIWDVAIDPSGNVFVADSNNNLIQKFSPGSSAPTTTTTVASPAATTTTLPSPEPTTTVTSPAPTTTTLPPISQKLSAFFYVQSIAGGKEDNTDFYYRGGPITSPIKTPYRALARIPVRLLDRDGKQLTMSVTDYTGFIKFRYVEPGYTVQFNRGPAISWPNSYAVNIPAGIAYGTPSPIGGALVTLALAPQSKPTVTTTTIKVPTTIKKPIYPKPLPIPGPVTRPMR